MMRFWFLLILGGLPLLVYPFLLIANIMSLAAHQPNPPVPFSFTNLAWLSFLWGSTVYPLVYLGCALVAVILSFGESDHIADRFAMIPLLYLAALIACFLFVMAFAG